MIDIVKKISESLQSLHNTWPTYYPAVMGCGRAPPALALSGLVWQPLVTI